MFNMCRWYRCIDTIDYQILYMYVTILTSILSVLDLFRKRDNFISVAQLNTTFVHLHTCVSFRSKAYFRIAKWIDPEIYRWFTCVHYVETNIVYDVFCMVFFFRSLDLIQSYYTITIGRAHVRHNRATTRVRRNDLAIYRAGLRQ